MELTEHSYAELILTNSIRVGSQQDYLKKRPKYIKTINEMSYNKKNQQNLILEWIDLEATSRTRSDAHRDAVTRPGLDIDRGRESRPGPRSNKLEDLCKIKWWTSNLVALIKTQRLPGVRPLLTAPSWFRIFMIYVQKDVLLCAAAAAQDNFSSAYLKMWGANRERSCVRGYMPNLNGHGGRLFAKCAGQVVD
jgi:hypothetical protein